MTRVDWIDEYQKGCNIDARFYMVYLSYTVHCFVWHDTTVTYADTSRAAARTQIVLYL